MKIDTIIEYIFPHQNVDSAFKLHLKIYLNNYENIQLDSAACCRTRNIALPDNARTKTLYPIEALFNSVCKGFSVCRR